MNNFKFNPQKFLKTQRFLAFFLDYVFVFSLFLFAATRIFAVVFTPFSFAAVAAVAFIAAALIDTVLLAVWGKTLGHAILNLFVRKKGSFQKLSFKQAFAKSFLYSFANPAEKQTSSIFLRWGSAVVIALSCWLGLSESFSSIQRSSGASEFQLHSTVSGWKTYNAPELGFSVDFPTDPFKAENQLNLPGRNRNVSFQEVKSIKAEEQTSYSVSYVQVPKKWLMFRSSTLLNGALKVLSESDYEAEIVKKQVVSHRQYPALDFHIKQGDDILKGRLILVGSTLFRVMISQPKTQEASSDLRNFIDSFEPLIKKTPA